MAKEKVPRSRRTAVPVESPPEELHLAYRLAELPTSQHRAGLAGLLLLVRRLDRANPRPKGVLAIEAIDEGGAVLHVDRAGVRSLFEEVYAASMEEYSSAKLLKKRDDSVQPPLREEKQVLVDARTGKTKDRTMFVYERPVPRGGLLLELDPGASGQNGPWVKLWRDMIWEVFRGVPAQRRPFVDRAKGEPSTDADEAWTALVHEPHGTVSLPSTYFLGAQAFTGDRVEFTDRVRDQFLLHFWPLVAQVYVPVQIDSDGKTESLGWAIGAPDIMRLETFCDEYPQMLLGRSAEVAGFRPREAFIDVVAESGLDTLRRLRERVATRIGSGPAADVLLGVDVIHARKVGNNVRLLGLVRVEADATMVDEYARLRSALRDPGFRRVRIGNLVGRRAWHEGFDFYCETHDPRGLLSSRTFAHDCRISFEEAKGEPMADIEPTLEALIYRVVERYVHGRVAAKFRLTWDTVKDEPAKRAAFDEARGKIGGDAFLAVRSRSAPADFNDYFASVLCSVPQRLSQTEFSILARALRERPDEVRTLTLLALAAKS